jgi:hypothetical protein
VAKCDGAERKAGAGFGEKGTAAIAGQLFHVAGADWGLMDLNGKAELRGEFADEKFVSVGFVAAQVMVHMKDGDLVFGKAVKDVQEGDRISTGGDGNAHTVMSRQRVITSEAFGHLLG